MARPVKKDEQNAHEAAHALEIATAFKLKRISKLRELLDMGDDEEFEVVRAAECAVKKSRRNLAGDYIGDAAEELFPADKSKTEAAIKDIAWLGATPSEAAKRRGVRSMNLARAIRLREQKAVEACMEALKMARPKTLIGFLTEKHCVSPANRKLIRLNPLIYSIAETYRLSPERLRILIQNKLQNTPPSLIAKKHPSQSQAKPT